jgi:hypothetical protein
MNLPCAFLSKSLCDAATEFSSYSAQFVSGAQDPHGSGCPSERRESSSRHMMEPLQAVTSETGVSQSTPEGTTRCILRPGASRHGTVSCLTKHISTFMNELEQAKRRLSACTATRHSCRMRTMQSISGVPTSTCPSPDLLMTVLTSRFRVRMSSPFLDPPTRCTARSCGGSK